MSGLTKPQLKAAGILAKGGMVKEAAAAAGVAPRTIQRWLKQRQFEDAIANINDRTVEAIVQDTAQDISGQVKALVPKAVQVLEDFLNNSDAKGSDRLRACHIIGAWAGLTQPKQETTSAEQDFQKYIQLLSTTTNGNGNGTHHTADQYQ